jgi:exopolysaccharide production protein ExoQ
MVRFVRFLEYVFAIGALFFMTGGLTVTLTPESSPNSPLVQVIGVAIGLVALAGMLLRPLSLNRAAVLYWPVLLLVGFASFSVFWSIEPDLTIRRAGSLILTMFFALWLVERFDHRQIFAVVVATFTVLCLASWMVIVFDPSSGIHQVTDLETAAHAGSWRGLYYHKNDFGRAIALALVTFAAAATIYDRWVVLYLLLVVQAAVLIANSNSGQAIILAIVPSVTALMVIWLRNKSAMTRTMIIAVLLPLVVIAYMLSNVIFGAVLGALGKDESLTGRTDIWMATITAVAPNIAWGGGFGAGWDLVFSRVAILTGSKVQHAHNGYLDLVVDLGIIGLGILLTYALWLARMAFRAMFDAPHWRLGAFGLAFSVFYLLGNWAGSFLVLHNSIYMVLLITIFCSMRDLYNPYQARAVSRSSVQDPYPAR